MVAEINILIDQTNLSKAVHLKPPQCSPNWHHHIGAPTSSLVLCILPEEVCLIKTRLRIARSLRLMPRH